MVTPTGSPKKGGGPSSRKLQEIGNTVNGVRAGRREPGIRRIMAKGEKKVIWTNLVAIRRGERDYHCYPAGHQAKIKRRTKTPMGKKKDRDYQGGL